MSIQERRDNANKYENNTAQQVMLDQLKQLSPEKTTEIIFSEPMHGQLDFSALTDMGYSGVVSILLEEGEITDIRQLPAQLKKIVCSGNLLTSLDNLPLSLEELECENNSIQTIDLSKMSSLKIAKLANNKLTSLGELLPAKLEELYCENNKLTDLDLSVSTSMRLLHASGNPTLKIQNPPSTLVDLQMENDPFSNNIEHGSSDKQKVVAARRKEKYDYIESIQEYYRMKQKYEEKVRQLKRTAYEKGKSKKAARQRASAVIGPCVNCGRKVGTLFSKKEEIYSAICGDKNEPCSLNIRIDNSASYQIDQYLAIFQSEIDDIKENIIKRKMETLFHYVSDETSVQEFKQVLEEYHESNELYKQMRDKYDALYNNMYKKESLQRKQLDFHDRIAESKRYMAEYKETGNKELLKKSVELQVNELTRVCKDIRNLKYGIMEATFDEKTGEDVLFQRSQKLGDYDYFIGVAPKVLKFDKGIAN